MAASYGAIETKEQSTGTASGGNKDVEAQGGITSASSFQSFQEANMYFLKEKPASREEKIRKLILVGVPVFVAIIFMGGLAVWLLQDFNNLYPGYDGGHRSSSNTIHHPETITTTTENEPVPVSAPVPKPPSSTSTKTTTSNSSGGGGGGSTSCSSYPACVDLGLTGECCPTTQGVRLWCCS